MKSKKNHSELDMSCDVFPCETVRFSKFYVIFELNAKMYKEMAKIWLYEKRYIIQTPIKIPCLKMYSGFQIL